MKHLCDTAEHGLALLTHLLQAQIKATESTVFDLMMAECAGSSRGCGKDEGACLCHGRGGGLWCPTVLSLLLPPYFILSKQALETVHALVWWCKANWLCWRAALRLIRWQPVCKYHCQLQAVSAPRLMRRLVCHHSFLKPEFHSYNWSLFFYHTDKTNSMRRAVCCK